MNLSHVNTTGTPLSRIDKVRSVMKLVFLFPKNSEVDKYKSFSDIAGTVFK